jgi:hypothetical protein
MNRCGTFNTYNTNNTNCLSDSPFVFVVDVVHNLHVRQYSAICNSQCNVISCAYRETTEGLGRLIAKKLALGLAPSLVEQVPGPRSNAADH